MACSVLQILPHTMGSGIPPGSLPASEGTQYPQNCSQRRAPKVEPGLDPNPQIPSYQCSPAPHRQENKPSPAWHPTVKWGMGCPLKRAGWGAEAAKVPFREHTLCLRDPHSMAQLRGWSASQMALPWGFSLCAQPAHLVQSSNCSLSPHTQSARLASLHAP